MNCKEFELLVLALGRNQLMDATAHELGLVHANSCASCAGRLASERFLMAGARAVVTELAMEEAPPRVEAELLAAFREHVSASPAVMPMPMTFNSWSFWRPAAVAALILILISTMAVFWSISSSLERNNQQLTELSRPVSLPEPVVTAIEPRVETVKLPDDTYVAGPVRQRTSRRRSHGSHQVEVVTQFYPLVEGGDVNSEEVSQVVRVELPASALSAAGLSVGPEMSTVPVKADVALGYDGLARAIRFVR